MRTTSQRPVFLLLLCALTGAVISETLVSLCMAGAFFSGLLLKTTGRSGGCRATTQWSRRRMPPRVPIWRRTWDWVGAV